MTSRRQRSRAQHRHDLSVSEARRQLRKVVAETSTRPPLPEQLILRPVPDDARLVLHYRGDRRSVDTRAVRGPDMHGALYRPTGADYDPETDRTTMSFRPVLAGER